jgi:membrane associated rhomboid family serine protease
MSTNFIQRGSKLCHFFKHSRRNTGTFPFNGQQHVRSTLFFRESLMSSSTFFDHDSRNTSVIVRATQTANHLGALPHPPPGNGTFFLMLISCAIFILDHLIHVPGIEMLYLHSANVQWWQLITHQFCHGNLAHLSSNLFQLCVFGRFVEETEGFWGVIGIYLITGVGAALASMLCMPKSVGVGASGAIFGLFATSVLRRVSEGWSLKSLLEAVVLGNFVIRQLFEEMRMQIVGGSAMHGSLQVAHAAHLGGALAGILLILFLSKLPK